MGAFRHELNAAINSCRINTRTPEQTRELGRFVGTLAQPGDVYLLSGNLGAGKTCFTQGIARGLGIEEYVMSPSFVILREHHGRLPLYHVDLYRLEDVDEAADLGLDDYLYGKGVSVVEWAERARSVLPAEHLMVNIDYVGDDERCFRIEAKGKRYCEIIGQLKRQYEPENTEKCS
jgi:tRNA threonylcarbamoyladenosine biosynthesis protein TsaE